MCGPDAYRDSSIIGTLEEDARGRDEDEEIADEDRMNVQLSMDETYADVTPVRRDKGSVSAYVSVMRGCDNMCAFCVALFTTKDANGRDR